MKKNNLVSHVDKRRKTLLGSLNFKGLKARDLPFSGFQTKFNKKYTSPGVQ